VHTRRHFLKTVILGATAAPGLAGCRHDEGASAPAASPTPAPRETRLRGDHFETCHAVRDGQTLPTASVSASHDVVIVGGGPSGMSAAHLLGDRDLLLLEKEESWGGNCILDEWQGVRLSTGGAFYTESEADIVALFAEIGARGMKVTGGDSLVVDGQPVTGFFQDGAQQLPFAQKVKDDFRRSREEMLKLLASRRPEDLDRVSFAELLKDYDPTLTKFWDRFGPSNWGAVAADTSGYIGAQAYTWAGGMDDPRWTFPGGMAGGAQALADYLKPRLKERMQSGAAVYRIEREKRGAVVHYLQGGEPRAVRARVVIVALPKFYAQHVVPGLPAAQAQAMKACRYAPFPTFNVCLTSPGPEPAYDNWFLDAPFTDFIPADWVIYGGRGPKDRRTALTVYHPLPEARRKELLVDPMVLEMADAVADALERHFPGTLPKIAEIRAYRRGHPMSMSTPGRMQVARQASAALGSILFANTDSTANVSSFDGAYVAARDAVERAKKLLAA
jgi:predicted NAD/FAD-dependent oxidoreductase